MLEVVSLDTVRTDNSYNFISLCQNADDNIADKDCPFQCGQHHCDYDEPGEFRSMIDTNSLYDNVTSFFHLDCRSLSWKWDSFQTLLSDLQCNKFGFDIIGISEI